MHFPQPENHPVSGGQVKSIGGLTINWSCLRGARHLYWPFLVLTLVCYALLTQGVRACSSGDAGLLSEAKAPFVRQVPCRKRALLPISSTDTDLAKRRSDSSHSRKEVAVPRLRAFYGDDAEPGKCRVHRPDRHRPH